MINREGEVAKILCDVLESIIHSQSHTFEAETDLDHELADSELINDVEYEDDGEGILDSDWNDEEEDNEKALCKQFLHI